MYDKNSYKTLCDKYDALKKQYYALKKQHHAFIKEYGFSFEDIGIFCKRFQCRLALFFFCILLYLMKKEHKNKAEDENTEYNR